MRARSAALSLLSIFAAGEALAQGQNGQPPALPQNVLLTMFITGVVGIAIAWIAIPLIFWKAGKLDQLVDLLRHGAVIRFVTITYIVIVVVILGLTDRVTGDKVATLLAGIAGYVLGQGTRSREESDSDSERRREPKERVTLVRPDERPRPAPAAEPSA